MDDVSSRCITMRRSAFIVARTTCINSLAFLPKKARHSSHSAPDLFGYLKVNNRVAQSAINILRETKNNTHTYAEKNAKYSRITQECATIYLRYCVMRAHGGN